MLAQYGEELRFVVSIDGAILALVNAWLYESAGFTGVEELRQLCGVIAADAPL